MILSCPQCETRYLLPATKLGEGGRRVKCSNCSEIWHQEPDPEELAEFQEPEEPGPEPSDEPEELKEIEEPEDDQDEQTDDLSEVDDIPEGVKPIAEGASAPTAQEDGGRARHRMIGGVAASVFVFLSVFLGLYISHHSLVSSWPESAAFYEMLGMETDVPGEGLVFDRLAVSVEEDGKMELIKLEGHIINLTSQEQNVPLVEASLKDEHDQIFEKWIIKAPEVRLDAEGDIPFMSGHTAHAGQAKSVYLRFVLKAGEGLAVAEEETSEHAPVAAHGEHAEKKAEHSSAPDSHESEPSAHH